MPLAFLGNLLSEHSPSEWLDTGCAILVLLSIVIGVLRGLSYEMPASTGWAFGCLIGWYAFIPFHLLLARRSFFPEHPHCHFWAALLLTLLLAFGVGLLARFLLRCLFSRMERTAWDHVLGALFGLARGLLILLIVTMIMLGASWKTGHNRFCHQSITGRLFSPAAEKLLGWTKKICPQVHFSEIKDQMKKSFHAEEKDPDAAATPPPEPQPIREKKIRIRVDNDPDS